MLRRLEVFLLSSLLAALAVACTANGTPTATLSPTVSPSPTTTATATETATATPTPLAPTEPPQLRLEDVATGLQVPWALAFSPDGRLFFTERTGQLRVIVDGSLQAEPVATFEVAAVGEAGLLGLALDPDFSQNHYLYLYYTYTDGGGNLKNRLVRLREEGGSILGQDVLLDGIPGAMIHDGGRLKFGPDGKLYITTGDAAQAELAQQPDSLAGKILRLNPDGSIPSDNPFANSPVYSLGHRNPQGLAWHPETGDLYATEHGPSAHDELNLIRPGGNYGWPLAQGQAGVPGLIDPVLESGGDTWAPAGASFYSGARSSFWRNNLFFATLRGQHLHRLSFGADGAPLEQEQLLEAELGRLRDVVEGPDGYLYLAVSNRDGRGLPQAGDDRIVRLVIEAGP